MNKRLWSKSLILVILSVFTLAQIPANAALEPWAYDAGPNPNDPMGKELIDLVAEIPNFPEISEQVVGTQKFRPVYGPVAWRMRQAPNSVKILFIGQDATHIAEAAGRPATAGFGGRAQDLANYFGVDESAAFMNSYAFTIKGQAGSFTTPVFTKNADGSVSGQLSSFVDNGVWLMSYDLNSPITKWRNGLIDWILRNNKDSIKLVVLFGGAAREAAGAFLESKGRKVETRFSAEAMRNIQIPITKMVFAGGNNEFCTPLDTQGNDLYEKLLGSAPDYENLSTEKTIRMAITENASEWIESFVFSKGGPFNNGLIHPAQLGGYKLDGYDRETKKALPAISLKGVTLSDGTVLDHDVLVVQLPHPSSLSKMDKEEAAKTVAADLESFEQHVKNGWTIEADPGRVNKFMLPKPDNDYEYGRADIGPEYYDFGAPKSRMVSVSSAVRLDAWTIQIGSRGRVAFDKGLLEDMKEAKPSSLPDSDEMYTNRPRGEVSRYVFDPGPGEEFAKLMKQNLDLNAVFTPKSPTMQWSKFVKKGKEKIEVIVDGINMYNVKSHPEVGDFGHYRGTFENPRVFILADPDGADDLITARALTGTRGQYLHGMLSEMGVETDYLVLKTVPFIMDGATPAEWEVVREQTKGYRDAVIGRLFEKGKPALVITDGDVAATEGRRIFGEAFPIVNIKRGAKKDSGIAEAIAKINAMQIPGFTPATKPRMKDLPRKHLSFYARLWEGTSGDRVIGSVGVKDFRGLAFAEVAPEWAWTQDVPLDEDERIDVQKLLDKLEDGGFPMPREKVPSFLKRKKRQSFLLYPGYEELNQAG